MTNNEPTVILVDEYSTPLSPSEVADVRTCTNNISPGYLKDVIAEEVKRVQP